MLSANRRRARVRVVVILFAICASVSSYATVDVVIRGIVRDELFNPLPGATVVLHDAAGGTVGRATTAVDGTFAFPGITFGDYTVEASAPNKTGTHQHLQVTASDVAEVELYCVAITSVYHVAEHDEVPPPPKATGSVSTVTRRSSRSCPAATIARSRMSSRRSRASSSTRSATSTRAAITRTSSIRSTASRCPTRSVACSRHPFLCGSCRRSRSTPAACRRSSAIAWVRSSTSRREMPATSRGLSRCATDRSTRSSPAGTRRSSPTRSGCLPGAACRLGAHARSTVDHADPARRRSTPGRVSRASTTSSATAIAGSCSRRTRNRFQIPLDPTVAGSIRRGRLRATGRSVRQRVAGVRAARHQRDRDRGRSLRGRLVHAQARPRSAPDRARLQAVALACCSAIRSTHSQRSRIRAPRATSRVRTARRRHRGVHRSTGHIS